MSVVGAAALLLFTVAAFTPAMHHVTTWMGGAPVLARSEAIVVLGRGGADGGVLTHPSLRRLLHGIDLYAHGLAPLLVVSGSPAEVEARATLAEKLGVPSGAILRMATARTTSEEGQQLRTLLSPLGRHRILLVADPVDMPRTKAVMQHAGFVVLGAPTVQRGPSQPEARLGLVRDVLIEVAACIYYRVAGIV